jgi:hypothetical protein
MPVTGGEPAAVQGSRAPTLWVRRTPTLPALLGGLIAVTAITIQINRGHDLSEIYALALVTSTAGLGFSIDDPAAETVGASPTTLARRRLHSVAIAGSIVVLTWIAIAAAVATSDGQRFPTYDIAIELTALASIGLATSALVQRRTTAPGGPTAALLVLVGPLFMAGVVFRDARVFPSLIPGQDLRHRWIWLASLAAATLVHASHDEATRRRRRRAHAARNVPHAATATHS